MVPRSRCPACKAPIGALQNIPVLSYLALRGRCARCRAPISARYPLVEILCGVLSALVAWRFGYGAPAACAIVITWFLIALTFIDLDHQLLPDSLTMPLLWLGLLASLTDWGSASGSLPVDPVSAIGGAALGYLSLWVVYHAFRLLTGKEGMGYGDFKLLAAFGAWLGWRMLLPIVLLSAMVGALVGIASDRGTPPPARHADSVRAVSGRRRLVRDDVGPPARSGLSGPVRRHRPMSAARPRVGLTGGIASGKSTVSRLFGAHGVPVLDADIIAREVIAPGTALLATLFERFGPGIRAADGSLDRSALRRLVFSDDDRRRELEALLHPAIRARTEQLAAQANGCYQLHVVPLLVETHAQDRYDRILVVDCPESLQMARLRARDGIVRDGSSRHARLTGQSGGTSRISRRCHRQ